MIGIASSVIVVAQLLIVQDVGEFIIRSASLLLTVLKMLSLRVLFVRFLH